MIVYQTNHTNRSLAPLFVAWLKQNDINLWFGCFSDAAWFFVFGNWLPCKIMMDLALCTLGCILKFNRALGGLVMLGLVSLAAFLKCMQQCKSVDMGSVHPSCHS